MPADYFISYTSPDKAWAEWIGWVLEDTGATVILQAWDFVPGSNFVLEMQRAAASAPRTIAVLSPDYLTSRFAAPEWGAAFAQDPEGLDRRLVPVRVRDCALDGMLLSIVHIDLVGLSEAAARQRLSDGLAAKRGKPNQAPGFPGAGAGHGGEAPKPFPGHSLSNSPWVSFSALAFSRAVTWASVSTSPSCAILASSAFSRFLMFSRVVTLPDAAHAKGRDRLAALLQFVRYP
jgi:TIR domain